MKERGSVNRRQLLKGAVGLGAALSLPALLTACGSELDDHSEGGTLSVGVVGGGTSDTLDPNKAINTPDYTRLVLLFGALVVPDGTGQLTYPLADELRAEDSEGQTWILRVKEAQFHDGSPVTSDDVIASFKRLYNPESPAPAATLVPQIVPSRIEKLDARTVRIPLSSPVSVLPELLNPQYFPIIPASFDPKHPIGAGPYKYESFEPGNRSVFTRFDNYVAGPPALESVEIVNMDDNAALVNALLAKQINAAMQVPAPHIPRLEDAGYQVIRTPAMTTTLFTMRMDRPPFDDPRVRQAFRLLVDREKMVKQVYQGEATVGNDLYSTADPGMPATLPQRTRDVEKAKQLLAEAGHEKLVVDLYVAPIGTDWTPAALAFAEDAKPAGVTVNVHNIDVASWSTQHYLQSSFGMDFYPQQPYMLASSYSTQPDSPYSSTKINDEEYNALYAQALTVTDPADRNALIAKMATIEWERGGNIIAALQENLDIVPGNLTGLVDGGKFFKALNNYIGLADVEFTTHRKS